MACSTVKFTFYSSFVAQGSIYLEFRVSQLSVHPLSLPTITSHNRQYTVCNKFLIIMFHLQTCTHTCVHRVHIYDTEISHKKYVLYGKVLFKLQKTKIWHFTTYVFRQSLVLSATVSVVQQMKQESWPIHIRRFLSALVKGLDVSCTVIWFVTYQLHTQL
jgi:hypothetical protein